MGRSGTLLGDARLRARAERVDLLYHVGVPLTWLDNDAAERFMHVAVKRFALSAPDGVKPQLVLAVIEWRKGDAVAAIGRLRSAAAAYPQNAEAQGTLTEMAVLAETHDAVASLDQAIND